MIRFACPSCGESCESDDAKAGRVHVCGLCGHTFTVPLDPLYRRRLQALSALQKQRHLTAAELDETADLLAKTGQDEAAAKAQASAERQRARERQLTQPAASADRVLDPVLDADLAEKRAIAAMTMANFEPTPRAYAPWAAVLAGMLLSPLAVLLGLAFLFDADPRRRATGRLLAWSGGCSILGSIVLYVMIIGMVGSAILHAPSLDLDPPDAAPPTAAPAPTPPLAPAPREAAPQGPIPLEYRVRGEGQASVTYTTPAGQQVQTDVTLPWQSQLLYLNQNTTLALAAAGVPDSPVQAEIVVAGQVWASSSSRTGRVEVGGNWYRGSSGPRQAQPRSSSTQPEVAGQRK